MDKKSNNEPTTNKSLHVIKQAFKNRYFASLIIVLVLGATLGGGYLLGRSSIQESDIDDMLPNVQQRLTTSTAESDDVEYIKTVTGTVVFKDGLGEWNSITTYEECVDWVFSIEEFDDRFECYGPGESVFTEQKTSLSPAEPSKNTAVVPKNYSSESLSSVIKNTASSPSHASFELLSISRNNQQNGDTVVNDYIAFTANISNLSVASTAYSYEDFTLTTASGKVLVPSIDLAIETLDTPRVSEWAFSTLAPNGTDTIALFFDATMEETVNGKLTWNPAGSGNIVETSFIEIE